MRILAYIICLALITAAPVAEGKSKGYKKAAKILGHKEQKRDVASKKVHKKKMAKKH